VRAVLRLVAHEFSARWRGWVLLGLLVGVAGGAVLTAVAGARRTDSAYPRFLVASRAADVLVSPFNTGLDGYYRALAQLPEVAVVAPLVGLNVIPLRPDGRPAASGPVAVPADGRFGHQMEIPKLLAGRLPRPDRPGEVAVSQIGASSLHVHVGSTLVLGACAGQVCNRANTRRLRERVVGIFVNRGSVVPVTDLDKLAAMFASTALFDQLVHQLGPGIRGFDGAYVKLRPGVSPERFTRQAQALARPAVPVAREYQHSTPGGASGADRLAGPTTSRTGGSGRSPASDHPAGDPLRFGVIQVIEDHQALRAV
jgi:hypothetical protein